MMEWLFCSQGSSNETTQRISITTAKVVGTMQRSAQSKHAMSSRKGWISSTCMRKLLRSRKNLQLPNCRIV